MNERFRVLGLCCVVGLWAGVRTALAEESAAQKSLEDRFVGDYVGKFEPTKPSDGKSEAKKCGSCHAEASVQRAEKEYVLTLVVEHGKDKKGNPNKQRFILKGEPADGNLVCKNERYTITVADGKATGSRTGKVVASVTLERKPPSETKSDTVRTPQ